MVAEILAQMQRLGIKLWVDGDRLRYDAPQGSLTPELKDQLRANKTDIMAHLVRQQQAAEAIPSVPRTGHLALSFTQMRFWAFQMANPTDSFYNIHYSFQITGPLDAEALEQAFQALLRRHEVLRTTFPLVEGKPVQLIAEDYAFILPVVDLQAIQAADQMEEVHRYITTEVERPFDLASDLLLRVFLLRLASESHILVVCVHHIVLDNWSFTILYRELAAFYTTFTGGPPETLPPLSIQYADYAHWQHQMLTPTVLDTRLRYWEDLLRDEPPPLCLPTDYPAPTPPTFRAGLFWFRHSPQVTQQLKAASQQAGVTLYMMLVAAWATLLYRDNADQDIMIGTPVVGRTHQQLASVLGCIGSLHVLRVSLRDNPRFTDLLRRVYQIVRDAITYQDIAYEPLLRLAKQDVNRKRPLFRVLLSYLMVPPSNQLQLPNLHTSMLRADEVKMRPDLVLVIWEEVGTDGPCLQGWLQYKKDLFEAETIAQWMADFDALLAAIASDPTRTVNGLIEMGAEG